MTIQPRRFVALLAALCTSVAGWAAEPGAATKLEVEQLLTRLGVSDCQFQRNGTWYGAPKARTHLEQKYQYLLNKQLVGTAEDFISLAATQSSMSGKPYLVKCGTQKQMSSAAWMTIQLREVRATKRQTLPKGN
jgi:hypothetical protein